MRPSRPAAALVVIVALGAALQANSGLYSPRAMVFLCGALAGAAAFCFCGAGGRWARHMGFGAVALACAEGLASEPYNDVAASGVGAWGPHVGFYVAAAVAGVLALRWRWGWGVAAVAFGVMAASVIRHSPSPRVDVFVYQRDASAALVQGRNPYELTFPNPYSEEESWVFAPGTHRDGRILFGFPYWPIALLAVVPGHVAGDYRWAHVAALAATSAGLYTLGRNRAGAMGAILFLATPRMPFAVEWGWTEPVTCALLAWTLVAVERWPRARALMLGTLLLSKQYVVLLAPLARRAGVTRRNAWWALLPAGVTAALALWDWRAFYESTVALQFRQPFRPDALSLPALLFAWTGRQAPSLLGPLAGLGASCACAIWGRGAGENPLRASTPISLSGEGGDAVALARGVALSLLAFFALSKQAFANYYLLVIAAWCAVLVLECRDTTSSSSGAGLRGSRLPIS